MNLFFLEEAELQFGGGRHIDIRFGIMNYGPLDFDLPLSPKQINLGVVGSKESVEGVRQWLERCRTEIVAKPSKGNPDKPNKQPNLFTRFPGFTPNTGFCSTLTMDDTLCRDFPSSSITEIAQLPDRNERIARSVDLFMEEIQYLAQNTPAKVIVCAVPLALLEAMGPEEEDDDETDERAPGIVGPELD